MGLFIYFEVLYPSSVLWSAIEKCSKPSSIASSISLSNSSLPSDAVE